MKISNEEGTEKKVPWNNGVRKAVLKMHERYLWVSLLFKLQVM